MSKTYVCMTCGKIVEPEQEYCACGHNKIGWYPSHLTDKTKEAP